MASQVKATWEVELQRGNVAPRLSVAHPYRTGTATPITPSPRVNPNCADVVEDLTGRGAFADWYSAECGGG